MDKELFKDIKKVREKKLKIFAKEFELGRKGIIEINPVWVKVTKEFFFNNFPVEFNSMECREIVKMKTTYKGITFICNVGEEDADY